MNWGEKKPVFIARIFLFIIYFVGIIGISLPSLRDLFVPLTPYTLLISMLILLAFHWKWDLRFIAAAVIIALAGLGVEVLGVQTGLIFGGYSYGPVLGIKIGQVPLMIALNWILLIYCSYFIAGKVFKAALLKMAMAAALMVALDVLMEPVAIDLNMWNWEVEIPPLQNYAAWFFISFLFAGFFHVMKVKILNPLAGYLFLFLVMFFGILNLTI